MSYSKQSHSWYVCETCGHNSTLSCGGTMYEVKCDRCGGVSYRDPFPSGEAMKRIDALIKRLEKEDGPIDALPV